MILILMSTQELKSATKSFRAVKGSSGKMSFKLQLKVGLDENCVLGVRHIVFEVKNFNFSMQDVKKLSYMIKKDPEADYMLSQFIRFFSDKDNHDYYFMAFVYARLMLQEGTIIELEDIVIPDGDYDIILKAIEVYDTLKPHMMEMFYFD